MKHFDIFFISTTNISTINTISNIINTKKKRKRKTDEEEDEDENDFFLFLFLFFFFLLVVIFCLEEDFKNFITHLLSWER